MLYYEFLLQYLSYSSSGVDDDGLISIPYAALAFLLLIHSVTKPMTAITKRAPPHVVAKIILVSKFITLYVGPGVCVGVVGID